MKRNDAGTYKIPIKASYNYPNGLTQKFESVIILEIYDDRKYIYKPKYKSENPKNENKRGNIEFIIPEKKICPE